MPAKTEVLSQMDQQVAEHALRAILESLLRLSGTVATLARSASGFDIDPPGLVNVLRDAGADSFNVGADAIEKLEALLGVEVRAREGEVDPIAGAYRDFRGAAVSMPASV